MNNQISSNQINDLGNFRSSSQTPRRTSLLYPRINSRTATTILRRRPSNVYGQVLMAQTNRWRAHNIGNNNDNQDVSAGDFLDQHPPSSYNYGADFNTNFNTQYNDPLRDDRRRIRPISPEIVDDGNFRSTRSPTTNTINNNINSNTNTNTTHLVGTKIPRRTGRNLPYRVLYRTRPRHRIRNGIDYMPPSNLIRLFGESSVPGVRDIALSQSFVRRIFWICSFVFFGFLALRDISQLVSEYYTYPITVDVRLRDSRRLQFPAVTVCNMNIVRYSALCIANVSVIKDSMIPRDLKEKLCGIPPTGTSTASTVVHSMTGTTLVSMAAAAAAAHHTTPTTTTGKPMGTTNAAHQHRATVAGGGNSPGRKKAGGAAGGAGATTTTTTSTTPATPNDANEGMDDINTYGVLSNYSQEMGGNETSMDNVDNNENVTESTPDTATTTTTHILGNNHDETVTTPSTTTTEKSFDGIPEDIAAPILELENTPRIEWGRRYKRRVKPLLATSSSSKTINNNTTTDNVDNHPGRNATPTQTVQGVLGVENPQQLGQSTRQSNRNSNHNPNPNPHSNPSTNPNLNPHPNPNPNPNPRTHNNGSGSMETDRIAGREQDKVFTENIEIELSEREEKELQENLTNWLAVIYNSNEKIAKQLGHQYEDFVLRCTIRSTNCTHETSFEQFFTPTEGNCFTFKSQNLRKTYLERIKDETSIAGVNYGLELVLNLEIMEYLTGTAQIGAIIMVQHPDELGSSASEAIFVAPQQSTYIGLKMVNISRLPKPFPEECIDHWPTALVGRLTQNASYSQQACLKICLQRTIHTRCQCQSAQLPQLELNSTLKICDTRRKITRNCVEEVMFQAEEKVSTCKCPPRCQVINYDKTVSMTKWPTREDKVTFDRGKTNINFQNLAKVTVYFQTMTCQEVRQEKAYTTAKLFSSLGGILGMYVGFSFLSLFEILEIFARRFWYVMTKKNIRFRTAVHAITATFAMKKNNNNAGANPAAKIPSGFDADKLASHSDGQAVNATRTVVTQI